MIKNKYFVSCVLLIVISFFTYRALKAPIKTEVITTSDSLPVTAHDKLIPASLKVLPKKPIVYEGGTKTQSKTEDESFIVFDQIEKNWLKNAQEIMGEEKFEVYSEMRNRSEKEKLQAYKEYHDYLRSKYGDKFTYNISEDQSVREKEINQRYLKELVNLLGEEKFKEYTSQKDQFNEKIRRENKTSVLIEY